MESRNTKALYIRLCISVTTHPLLCQPPTFLVVNIENMLFFVYYVFFSVTETSAGRLD